MGNWQGTLKGREGRGRRDRAGDKERGLSQPPLSKYFFLQPSSIALFVEEPRFTRED